MNSITDNTLGSLKCFRLIQPDGFFFFFFFFLGGGGGGGGGAFKIQWLQEWAFKIHPPKNKSDTSRNTTGSQARSSVGLPYIRGTSEKLARIFKNHGVRAYHKPFNTLRSILIHPKDNTPDHKKCGVVYEIQCPQCPAQYVGETARTLETRMKDHLKQKSP